MNSKKSRGDNKSYRTREVKFKVADYKKEGRRTQGAERGEVEGPLDGCI